MLPAPEQVQFDMGRLDAFLHFLFKLDKILQQIISGMLYCISVMNSLHFRLGSAESFVNDLFVHLQHNL